MIAPLQQLFGRAGEIGMTNGSEVAVTTLQIGGKPVTLFDSHHLAFLPWQDCERSLPAPPRLLSLDTHTDSMVAFRGRAGENVRGSSNSHEKFESERLRLLSNLVASDAPARRLLIDDLRHDEHIDAAINCGIIDIAFVIARMCEDCIRSNEQIEIDEAFNTENPAGDDCMPRGTISVPVRPIATPPFSFSIPSTRIVILDDQTERDEEDAYRKWRDSLLESDFLNEQLTQITTICASAGVPSLFEQPFILDIDLDAFNTRRAMAPASSTTFYDLVRRAASITIAREHRCVEVFQMEGEHLTAEWLENELLRHIKTALGT